MENQILLSVTIPTYNRASFLDANLAQLKQELLKVKSNNIEIIVSDNCSTDNTEAIVSKYIKEGLPIRYVKNLENLGWGLNFFQCFNLAKGKYLIILSDDDLIYDNGLEIILNSIQKADYGVICLSSYGFNQDIHTEYPTTAGQHLEFDDFDKYFISVVPQITLLSSTVINKNLLLNFETSKIEPGNFAHLHLILRCAARSKKNAFITNYVIAVKRDNSSNYIYSKLFVNELWSLFDFYASMFGLKRETLRWVEARMLLSYYPAALLRIRLSKNSEKNVALADFDARFMNQTVYRFWTRPILALPRLIAVPYGMAVSIIGKVYNGEFARTSLYLKKRIKSLF